METLNVFNILTLKQIFLKTIIFFKKPEHSFLVESTKIENVSFSYKTAISKPNVKANRILSTKWSTKNGVSASNYFIFLKTFFQFKKLDYKELIWCTKDPNVSIFVSAFSLWVSLKSSAKYLLLYYERIMNMKFLNPIQDVFGAAHRWGRGRGAKRPPL